MPVKPPRPHSLYDFRMQDVSYEIVTLGAGENLPRRAGVAGYFYHVLKGSVQVTSADYGAIVAGCRDTIMVSGFIGHSVEQIGEKSTQLLIGSEPMEFLAWLGGAPVITCFRADSRNPMLPRLFLAMDLVVEEITHPEIKPDQLTLERTAELIVFYFFRMGNPVTGELDPYPWSDPRLMKAISAINEDPIRDWSVAELADIANMSRSAFSERFTNLIGWSPIKMLASIRLKLAARKMLEGESISKTAIACGYTSVEAFNRAFKREFSTTPGRWLRGRET